MEQYLILEISINEDYFHVFFPSFLRLVQEDVQTTRVKIGFDETRVITCTLQPDACVNHAQLLHRIANLYKAIEFPFSFQSLTVQFVVENRQLTVSMCTPYCYIVSHLEKFFWGVDIDLKMAWNAHHEESFVRYVPNETIV
ncbi:MAG: hypothetical protein COA82_03485 [Alkaliphilus sp.]|nr:MAG: hypothetical protein COA82_03485 [Alkaliphilus sp.]